MDDRYTVLLREVRYLSNLVNQLSERVETLELPNLPQRLEQAEELARRRELDLQMQLTRLAEAVADLATR